MQSLNRREEILNILKNKTEPVSGSILSGRLGVSRQVIVQDIAILRASGVDISATPAGYIIPEEKQQGLKKIVACHHERDNTEKELQIIVDNGGKVIDVIVEHPLYGEIRGMLMLRSRADIKRFMKEYIRDDTKPLSFLTFGIHLHTIEVPDEETYALIQQELKENKYLIDTE